MDGVIMDKRCETCASWLPDTCRQLETSGHCYRLAQEPKPKNRYSTCGDWVEADPNEPVL